MHLCNQSTLEQCEPKQIKLRSKPSNIVQHIEDLEPTPTSFTVFLTKEEVILLISQNLIPPRGEEYKRVTLILCPLIIYEHVSTLI